MMLANAEIGFLYGGHRVEVCGGQIGVSAAPEPRRRVADDLPMSIVFRYSAETRKILAKSTCLDDSAHEPHGRVSGTDRSRFVEHPIPEEASMKQPRTFIGCERRSALHGFRAFAAVVIRRGA